MICCITALLLSQSFDPLYSQETSKRPSIGLVLSGGGAHGIAHLGVIKVMEEAGLRPDYITGVSMGSIIGGMYAIGYSSDSLYSLLKTINWDDNLSNKIPENRVIFPEKEHFYNSILSLSITSKKLVIPSGLINGQMIENTLSYYCWPAADINDFSRLPIPFMCVGTDIITYKKINLNTGYLPDAIRASFSVPSIFTPIRIDTLLLLDGGLIRNFAASEAKAMGADILIGSYVGFDALKEEELHSLPGIIKQIALYRSLEDFYDQKKLVDILIKPNTDRLPATDFNNIDSLIQIGYAAAIPFREQFRKLADSLDRFGAPQQRKSILDKQYYTFDKIEVNGNKLYSDNNILGVLDIKPGEQVDKNKLTHQIELLYGNAWFDKVKYRIVPRNDSLVLNIECEERPQALLYGALHFDNSLQTGLILGLSVKNLLTKRSVININSYLGTYYRFKANLLQYIDRNQRFGFFLNYHMDNTLLPKLEINGEVGNTFSQNYETSIGINNYSGLNNMITLSGIYENRYLVPDYVSDNMTQNHLYNFLTTSFIFSRNTLNSKHFPDRGLTVNVMAGASNLVSAYLKTDASRIPLSEKSFDPTDRFYTMHANFRLYITSVKKCTFSLGMETLFITDADTISSQNNYYYLGGIQSDTKRSIPMTGFHPNEIPIRKMAGIRSELDLELVKDLHLSIMADIAAIEDVRYNTGLSILSGYGLGLGYMSIIGPVKAGIMYGSYKDEKYYNNIKAFISIGYNF